tara:strand:- start:19276 stop:20358 length:1083 start_codon:yes stop_codon:yes gene_type:complete
MQPKKPKLIYVIGPNFCVKSLAYESLLLLSKTYEVICISEGPKIEDINFKHSPIIFNREPSPFKDLLSLIQLSKLIFHNRDAKKIVISTPKISLLAAIACLLNFKSYIYLHRGAVYQNFIGTKFIIYKLIDKFIISFSSNTSYISLSLFKWIKSNLKIKKINYNRNFNSSKGVDLQKFFVKKDSSLNDLKIIGYCGRVASDKGYDELINLVNEYSSNANVLIKIKGKVELNRSDSELFFNLIKKKEIIFEKWDENVVNFYQNIDLLFFPTKREGFGNVAIEAAACGVPTVAFNIPGVSDAIKHDVSGILVDQDDDICKNVKKLINNDQKLMDLSFSSRLFIENNFDQDIVLKDLHRSMGL